MNKVWVGLKMPIKWHDFQFSKVYNTVQNFRFFYQKIMAIMQVQKYSFRMWFVCLCILHQSPHISSIEDHYLNIQHAFKLVNVIKRYLVLISISGWLLQWWGYRLYLCAKQIKALVHFQNKILIIFSPPCHPRCLCISLFIRKENKVFD